MIVGWFQGYKQKTKHPTGERLEKRKKKMKETEAQAKLSLKLQAYQYLKTKILNCEYRPNEFLNEQKLCAEMGNISRKDLQTPTPYNTYVIPALPPTPIAAPTWASIEAAVNPADTRFLYFVSKGDGSSHFSQSLAEHNRAVRQFILNRPKTQKKAKPKEPQPTKETARSITPV